MTKITIEIDCGKETCGDCILVKSQGSSLDEYNYEYCAYFGIQLEETGILAGENNTLNYKRLPECIAAEVKKYTDRGA